MKLLEVEVQLEVAQDLSVIIHEPPTDRSVPRAALPERQHPAMVFGRMLDVSIGSHGLRCHGNGGDGGSGVVFACGAIAIASADDTLLCSLVRGAPRARLRWQQGSLAGGCCFGPRGALRVAVRG